MTKIFKVSGYFVDVDFKTDYWSDGAYCNCPLCDKEIELGDFDYD